MTLDQLLSFPTLVALINGNNDKTQKNTVNDFTAQAYSWAYKWMTYRND